MEGSTALERGQQGSFEEERDDALAAKVTPLLGVLAADEALSRPVLEDGVRDDFIDRHFDAMDSTGG